MTTSNKVRLDGAQLSGQMKEALHDSDTVSESRSAMSGDPTVVLPFGKGRNTRTSSKEAPMNLSSKPRSTSSSSSSSPSELVDFERPRAAFMLSEQSGTESRRICRRRLSQESIESAGSTAAASLSGTLSNNAGASSNSFGSRRSSMLSNFSSTSSLASTAHSTAPSLGASASQSPKLSTLAERIRKDSGASSFVTTTTSVSPLLSARPSPPGLAGISIDHSAIAEDEDEDEQEQERERAAFASALALFGPPPPYPSGFFQPNRTLYTIKSPSQISLSSRPPLQKRPPHNSHTSSLKALSVSTVRASSQDGSSDDHLGSPMEQQHSNGALRRNITEPIPLHACWSTAADEYDEEDEPNASAPSTPDSVRSNSDDDILAEAISLTHMALLQPQLIPAASPSVQSNQSFTPYTPPQKPRAPESIMSHTSTLSRFGLKRFGDRERKRPSPIERGISSSSINSRKIWLEKPSQSMHVIVPDSPTEMYSPAKSQELTRLADMYRSHSTDERALLAEIAQSRNKV
ncbi:uncharacterized protein L969DRAFT_104544 [Mixia osmundae IAM 14324]|uniref:Uncharacterized protein n=1 Tax=Mixia osmundae (strain CBS 9802 / IAM 14324 / JCM 22182 / KY 12970) TaxID=764103 RepID=G7DSM0_MIXOS|nr:uncharacterized protein L969DRAFT_104544 [Mixia osmundae IAM 14324]KEI37924.1 hypothetical protein L969DRAFT_104544 [Mixia osmundae IAM 14324]GAA93580.1 hypothetical protein E5Q_00224 [Mixia osmundae IAM 14324]